MRFNDRAADGQTHTGAMRLRSKEGMEDEELLARYSFFLFD
jgi:hypothetical protein